MPVPATGRNVSDVGCASHRLPSSKKKPRFSSPMKGKRSSAFPTPNDSPPCDGTRLPESSVRAARVQPYEDARELHAVT